MIHGGGHVMLSRRDVRPKQTQLLIGNGRLPVSIDYRLCPEVNIVEGPMTDVCDGLQWVRNTLPQMNLKYPDLKIDGENVIVVSWSTGGTLAMSLAWSPKRDQTARRHSGVLLPYKLSCGVYEADISIPVKALT